MSGYEFAALLLAWGLAGGSPGPATLTITNRTRARAEQVARDCASGAAEVLLLAGDLAADKGDYEKARKLYEKAAKETPTVATYAGLLASR